MLKLSASIKIPMTVTAAEVSVSRIIVGSDRSRESEMVGYFDARTGCGI